ncbi:hypothetical protein VP01_3042g2 [Puccinia sorghi]|uniref:Uncharacterized protein n=1 Tax=Puccinia sorghi TaxID=27349 RepID=A0A0L6V0R0_9BASI|nr:hypothetical protein VP01_3042g2 [Puccinia sorghi]
MCVCDKSVSTELGLWAHNLWKLKVQRVSLRRTKIKFCVTLALFHFIIILFYWSVVKFSHAQAPLKLSQQRLISAWLASSIIHFYIIFPSFLGKEGCMGMVICEVWSWHEGDVMGIFIRFPTLIIINNWLQSMLIMIYLNIEPECEEDFQHFLEWPEQFERYLLQVYPVNEYSRPVETHRCYTCYRMSLETLESLICLKDWLKHQVVDIKNKPVFFGGIRASPRLQQPRSFTSGYRIALEPSCDSLRSGIRPDIARSAGSGSNCSRCGSPTRALNPMRGASSHPENTRSRFASSGGEPRSLRLPTPVQRLNKLWHSLLNYSRYEASVIMHRKVDIFHFRHVETQDCIFMQRVFALTISIVEGKLQWLSRNKCHTMRER